MADVIVRKEAVIAEPTAANNRNAAAITNEIIADIDNSVAKGETPESIKDIQDIAFIPNEKPIYFLNPKGNPQILFFAGWWLSPSEQERKAVILKDKELLKLNEKMWKELEEAGYKVEVESGGYEDVIVKKVG